MFKETANTVATGFNWNDIERDVVSETPVEDDFVGDDCYSEAEVDADKAKIQEIKRRLNISEEDGISLSRVQEYAISQEIGEMDWFGEEFRREELFPDGEETQTAIFLSSEYDDFVNHIDAIGLMKNADSNGEPVPFALDMTYNKTFDGLDKKMSWVHPNKKVRLPGFATAKYFEDTFNPEPLINRGKIPIMPRFIIGFSPELSEEITELRMSASGWDSLRRDELSAKAKWCVLTELKGQSKQMLDYLEEHHAENDLLETAYTQVKALDKFFGEAIKVANITDQSHPDWKNYVYEDGVVNAIAIRKIF